MRSASPYSSDPFAGTTTLPDAPLMLRLSTNMSAGTGGVDDHDSSPESRRPSTTSAIFAPP
jgi:hypothetical protein